MFKYNFLGVYQELQNNERKNENNTQLIKSSLAFCKIADCINSLLSICTGKREATLLRKTGKNFRSEIKESLCTKTEK